MPGVSSGVTTSLACGVRIVGSPGLASRLYSSTEKGPDRELIAARNGGSVKNFIVGCLAIFLAATVLTLRAGSAQGPYDSQAAMSNNSSDPRDLSGFWALSIDSRQIPPAVLVPTVTKTAIEKREKADQKAIRWCNLLGMPYIMDPGRPIDIQLGKREMVVFAEVPASPRHIYLDRSAHIDPQIFDPTTNGDSIGHWEGNTLVVDTIGFHPDRGITAIPGGGFRTATTHLVEQYQLLENGALLSVKFTWSDPKVYKTPHSYEFHYYRMPANYEPPPGLPCNQYDDLRTQFLGFTPAAVRKPSDVPGAR